LHTALLLAGIATALSVIASLDVSPHDEWFRLYWLADSTEWCRLRSITGTASQTITWKPAYPLQL